MKNKRSQLDCRVTPSSGNVFVDLGFGPAEAQLMTMRVELLISLQQHLDAKGWTQAEAARRLGITQPRVSKLKKGAAREFSLDMLLLFAARLGLAPEVRLAA